MLCSDEKTIKNRRVKSIRLDPIFCEPWLRVRKIDEYAHNQYKEKEFILKVSDIKQIHTLLMRYEKNIGIYLGDLGEYRKANIEVSKATYKAIDVYFVKIAMNLLVKWVNCVLPYSRLVF